MRIERTVPASNIVGAGPKPFGVWRSVGLAGLAVTCSFGAVAAAQLSIQAGTSAHFRHAIPAAMPRASAVHAVLLTARELGAGAVVLAFLPALARARYRDLGFVRPSTRAIGLAVAAALVQILVSTGYRFALRAVHQEHHVQRGFEHFRFTSLADFACWIAVAAIVAPMCEEVFFRAFAFNALRAHMSVWPATIVSSALFASIHGDLIFFPPLMVMGMIAVFVYRRSGSLVTAMLLHGFYNATVMIFYLTYSHVRA